MDSQPSISLLVPPVLFLMWHVKISTSCLWQVEGVQEATALPQSAAKGPLLKSQSKIGGWEREEKCQNDFLVLSWEGTTRWTAWACQSRKFKSKALFTAVWWKGSKCLPVYVLWLLVDLDCDIWCSPCLYGSSGMDWQLRRQRMSELGYKSRGGAG